jgi:hypothetical protein
MRTGECSGDAVRLEGVLGNFFDEAKGGQGAQEMLQELWSGAGIGDEVLVADSIGRRCECGEDVEIDADLGDGPLEWL